MNTQNRVTTASRTAAGFGATNMDPQNITDTLGYMGLVVKNTVTETLDLSPELWDIWSIYAETNINGTAFLTPTIVHTGTYNVVTQAEWAGMLPSIQADMLAALQSDCGSDPDCAADIEVVASIPFHNIDTILGLPIWQWTGFSTVRGLTVMRIGERTVNTGCPLIPIAVHLEQYSLYPSDWTCGNGDPNPPCVVADWRGPWNAGSPWYGQDPVYKFPTSFSSPYPSPYENIITNTLVLNTMNYKENVPGTPLQMAQGTSGNIYTATLGIGPGSFNWVSWDGSNPSLAYPGDFTNKYPGGPADMTLGDGDGILEIGEEVPDAPPIDESGFQPYILNGYRPAIIIYENKSGSNYQVYGFANIEVVGYNSGENWILFKIIQWPAEQCSFQASGYTGP